MLSINTNLNAQNAAVQIGNAQKSLTSASEKLTTGSRINKAADDVSGAALANRLSASSTKTAQFIKNAQESINMIQTADGAIKQQQDLVARMQELAYKAENGTNTTEDRELVQKEFDQMALELERNIKTAEFNGQKLLDGTLSVSVVVGEGVDSQMSVAVATLSDVAALVDTGVGSALDISGTLPADADAWKTDIHDLLSAAATQLNEVRSDLGSAQNRLEFTVSNLETTKGNIDSSLSFAQDTDFAVETATLARAKVLNSASQAMLSQANKQAEEVTQLLR